MGITWLAILFSIFLILYQGSNSVFFLGVTTYFNVIASANYNFNQLNSTAYYVNTNLVARFENSTLFSILQGENVYFSPIVNLSYSYIVNYDNNVLTIEYPNLTVISNSSLHPQPPTILPPIYMPFNLNKHTIIHIVESYPNSSIQSIWGNLNVKKGDGWVNISLSEFNITILKFNNNETLYPYTIIINMSYLNGELHYYHLHFSTEIHGRPYVYSITFLNIKKKSSYTELLIIPIVILIVLVFYFLLKRKKRI